MTTSRKDASKAGRLLRVSTSAAVRSVAGSDLAQRKQKSRKSGARKTSRGKS